MKKEVLKEMSSLDKGFVAALGVGGVLSAAWTKSAIRKYGSEKNVPLPLSLGMLAGICGVSLITMGFVASQFQTREARNDWRERWAEEATDNCKLLNQVEALEEENRKLKDQLDPADGRMFESAVKF